MYMQVLEGSFEDVHEIYDSILKDSRNNGNVILLEEEIEQRDFPNWSMGFQNLEASEPEDVPGFIDIFNGKLDKEVALKNTAKAVKLLINFSKPR